MENYSIPVTGELDLEIEADLIFEESTYWVDGKDNNRYHKLNIYEAVDDDGTYYVLHIFYKTQWQGEPEISEAWECETKEEVAAQLQDYDPLAHLVGFPTGERYDERQERLKQRLAFNWKNMMVEALKELGIKREGRKTKPNTKVLVTISPALKNQADKANLDLSELLETAIKNALV